MGFSDFALIISVVNNSQQDRRGIRWEFQCFISDLKSDLGLKSSVVHLYLGDSVLYTCFQMPTGKEVIFSSIIRTCAEQQRAGERRERRVEKRSAPLRSGSMFCGDLAAVNLKVDHFFPLFLLSSTFRRHWQKEIIILSIVLLKSFWPLRDRYLSAWQVQKANPHFQMQMLWLFCEILCLNNT